MKVLATLTLKVWYDDMTELEAKERLISLAEYAANRGLLSGGGPGTVDTWDATVTTKIAVP